jgi:hypothetical protein
MIEFIGSVAGAMFRFVGKVLFGAFGIVPFFGGGAMLLVGIHYSMWTLAAVGLFLVVCVFIAWCVVSPFISR